MIGIDIVQISRIEAALERGAFLRGAFSPAEQEYYFQNGRKAQTLAGFYAAKEAVIKALGIKISQIRLSEIEIRHHQSGKPYLTFAGKAFQQFSSYNASISISHDGDYAIAAAVLQPISSETNLEALEDSTNCDKSLQVPSDRDKSLQMAADGDENSQMPAELCSCDEDSIIPKSSNCDVGNLQIPKAHQLCEDLAQKIREEADFLTIPKSLTNIGERISLPLRKSNSHKGDYGRIRVIAGSESMTGAGFMSLSAARAALKSGGGLVSLCIPYSLRGAYQDRITENMLLYRPAVFDEEAYKNLAKSSDSIVIGMGMGANQSYEISQILAVLSQHLDGTLIIDADALNALCKYTDCIKNHKCKLILTPHLGEFQRLIKAYDATKHNRNQAGENSRNQANEKSFLVRAEMVRDLAQRLDAVVICKDYISTISDGESVFYNTSGTPAMAKGGSGDVLAGIISAVCVRLPALDSVLFAAYKLGRAAEAAAKIKGENALLASEIIEYLNI